MIPPPLAIQRWLSRAAFIAVLGFLLYAGLRLNPVPQTFHEEDKIYHLLGFAALAICTRMAFPHRPWWWQVFGALAVGGGIELLQTLEPARIGSIWDFLFDALGVGVGWLVLQLPILRRWRAS